MRASDTRSTLSRISSHRHQHRWLLWLRPRNLPGAARRLSRQPLPLHKASAGKAPIAPTRPSARSTIPLRPRLVPRDLVGRRRRLAPRVMLPSPLGLPPRRPRDGARRNRWPLGHRLRVRDLEVPRTTYPPPRASEVLRMTAPHPRRHRSRARMTGAPASRLDRPRSSTSPHNESST